VTLREIARLCGASESLSDELAAREPAGLTIDSRAVKPGDLFVAVPGARVDGHQFVREVFDKGACAALVVHQRLPFASELGADFTRLLFVTDTVCALQQMAARVLAAWNKPVVGITGSAGKTTIKDLTAHVLSAKGDVLKSLGNLNTGYGLPLTVARMITGGARPDDFALAVLEMGMSSFGEIARLADIAKPAIGVVGNVGAAHLEFFGAQERIARAKAELIDYLFPHGTAILNADDPLVSKMSERRRDLHIIRFGVENAAEIGAREIATLPALAGTRFVLQTPRGAATVELPLVGRHNVYNALAAAAAGHACDLSVETLAERLATAAPSRMRGEVLSFANGVTVFDDSYNSNPQALLQAVRALAETPGIKRRIVVAGEMLELGAQGAQLHRECGQALAELGVERLLGVRGLAQELVAGARAAGLSQASFCATTAEAAEQLLDEAQAGDLILVKGSRGVRMEHIIERLRTAFGDTQRQVS
jgi:UDP-N-acetylmuramoyl-tripeptide--D-alanyl-D-alanine ligase